MIGRLVSNNPAKAKDVELSSERKEIILGRSASCTVKLDDTRCSSNHCKISFELISNEWAFTIEDLSTNGTFLNGQKIGKGNKAPGKWGDTIDILKNPQVDDASKIGFVFEKNLAIKRKIDDFVPEKKPKPTEITPTPPAEVKPKPIEITPTPAEVKPKPSELTKGANDIDNKLSDTLKCQICMEIMHQPVSLIPCLHNFCGGCYSDWHKRADDCPSCRKKVAEVKRNHMIFSLIEDFLKKYPNEKRPQEEIEEQEEMNEFKQDHVVLKKDKKGNKNLSSDDSSSSSEEEEKKVPANRGRGTRAAPRARAQPTTAVQPQQNICRQCPKAFEGYKCLPGQLHILCTYCKQAMPDRFAYQKCTICTRAFCNLYWRASKCRLGLQQVDGYLNTIYSAIRPTAINENKYEQNVLNEYLKRKKLQLRVVAQEMMDAMEINKWDIELMGNKVQLTKNQHICNECAGLLWDFLIYKYRETIENDLEPNVKSRQKCWYGHSCTTQKHKLVHAQKLNHICEPSRK